MITIPFDAWKRQIVVFIQLIMINWTVIFILHSTITMEELGNISF